MWSSNTSLPLMPRTLFGRLFCLLTSALLLLWLLMLMLLLTLLLLGLLFLLGLLLMLLFLFMLELMLLLMLFLPIFCCPPLLPIFSALKIENSIAKKYDDSPLNWTLTGGLGEATDLVVLLLVLFL